jgi:hypothetical protein
MDSKDEDSKEEVAKQPDPSSTPHLAGEGEDSSEEDKEKKRRELRKSGVVLAYCDLY